jgi:hypothetical protein
LELVTAVSDLSMAAVLAAVSASLRQDAPPGFPALPVEARRMNGARPLLKKHLYVLHTSSLFMEPYQAACMAKKIGHQVSFYIAYDDHWTARKYEQACVEAEFIVLPDPQPGRIWHFISHAGKKLNAIARHFPSYSLIGFSSQFIGEFLGLLCRRRSIDAIIHQSDPDLVVLTIDVPGYDTGLFVKRARKYGAGTAVISDSMSNGLEEAEVYYYDRNFHLRGIIGSAIAWMFPKWKRVHKGCALLRVPPGRILALELFRLAPPVPWAVNSGHADAILVESPALVEYFMRAGLPRHQLRATGTITDDVMARLLANPSAKREFCSRYGLDPSKRMILVAVPPNSFMFTGGRPECDFQDYDALVEFFVASAASCPDSNVVLALHPSEPYQDRLKHERARVKVAREKTFELVPLCDLYVASVSSTIRWAIACGKPVLNYDVYRYRYDDFTQEPGVLITEEQHEFRRLLNKLTTDSDFCERIRSLQKGRSRLWGTLDGNSGQRMLEALDQISSRACNERNPLTIRISRSRRYDSNPRTL